MGVKLMKLTPPLLLHQNSKMRTEIAQQILATFAY